MLLYPIFCLSSGATMYVCSMDSPEFSSSLIHPNAERILDMLAVPENLENRTWDEVRGLIEQKYGFEQSRNVHADDVLIGWGGFVGRPDARTGVGFISEEGHAALLGVDCTGSYVLEMLASNEQKTTSVEERRIMELLECNLFQYFEQTQAFRIFVRCVRACDTVRKECSLSGRIAAVRGKISEVLAKWGINIGI